MDSNYPQVKLTITLSSKDNKLLTEAGARSKRTKTREAEIRLSDHLANFPDIATLGKRFSIEELA